MASKNTQVPPFEIAKRPISEYDGNDPIIGEQFNPTVLSNTHGKDGNLYLASIIILSIGAGKGAFF